MKAIRINIEHNRREFYSAVPVCSIGYVESEQLNKFQIKPNLLQVGIRLKSSLSFIHNIHGKQEYINRFPHVVIKMPGLATGVQEDVFAEVLYFTYNRNLIPEFSSRHMLSDCLAWDIGSMLPIQIYIDELVRLFEKTGEYGNIDRIDQLCFMLFQELILCRNMKAMDSSAIEVKLSRIESYLRVHYKDHIDYDKLAHSFGMSRRSLFRHWKNHFGITQGDYLHNLKMKEAEFLLLESSKSVAEISESLNMGYAYFCAVFKEYKGITPMQFRLIHRNGNGT